MKESRNRDRHQFVLLPVLLAALCGSPEALVAQEAHLAVTVFDERTGETATDLSADRFSVRDGAVQLGVVGAALEAAPVDVLLLVDASLAGEAVRPLAEALVEAAREDEHLAIAAYDESAELLQDFTTDKSLLHRALARISFRALPRIVDAVFAAADGGFDSSPHHKALVVLSNGVGAGSRTPEGEVIALTRQKRISLYTVYVRNDARPLLRRLALRTGGAHFGARRLGLTPGEIADRVLKAVRNPYRVAVTGVFSLGDRIEVTIRSSPPEKKRWTASVRAVD